jgi:hypothetical protein
MSSDNSNIEPNVCLQLYTMNIQDLIEKYKENEYMMQRLYYHMTYLLPNTLEAEDKNHQERLERTHFLTQEQSEFIQLFLQQNKYYYLPNNRSFYEYNGKTYKMTKEDMIHHQLLKTISKDRILMDWKYKTKINVLKHIREKRHLFSSIPESTTIQRVLKLFHTTFFKDKTEVKYFLTILGDVLLKKKTPSFSSSLIFLVKPKAKQFLQELDSFCYVLTGINNVTQQFVTKFHENYDFNVCRLVKMNTLLSLEEWREALHKNGLNLFCVAAHYSKRFESSDIYLKQTSESMQTYTLSFVDKTPNAFLDTFCSTYLQKCETSSEKISWKQMQYIWKLFLSDSHIPNPFFFHSLKTRLQQLFSYDELTDSFLYVTSKYIPLVQQFNQFWEQTIVFSPEEEIEVDELSSLFKRWSKSINGTKHLTESDAIKILQHFYPSVDCSDNKYILGISSTLWNKKKEIDFVLSYLREKYQKRVNENTFISFDEAYDFYYDYCCKHKSEFPFVCSKRYFETFLSTSFSQWIEHGTFLSASWYNNNIESSM